MYKIRPLNLIELESRIDQESNEINSCQRIYAQDKINLFFNFIHEQPVSNRILERIQEDFSLLKNEIPENLSMFIHPSVKKKVKDILKTKEAQGAFGFFIIDEYYKTERKFDNHYFDAAANWYDLIGPSYDNRFECFKEQFFNPFVFLLKWYIYESQVRSEKDYFSRNEVTIINEKLDKLLAVNTASAEIIYEEVGDLKELIITVNKKNWVIILKEKFKDLILAGIINQENAEAVFKDIVGVFSHLISN